MQRNFWDVLASSIIISGFIVLVCIGTMAYLAANSRPIPETLAGICLTVVGFFFGSKSGASEQSALLARQREQEK